MPIEVLVTWMLGLFFQFELLLQSLLRLQFAQLQPFWLSISQSYHESEQGGLRGREELSLFDPESSILEFEQLRIGVFGLERR